MTPPNMATLTASLERSLRNCSLDPPSPHDPTRHRLFIPCLDLSDSNSDSTTTSTTTTVDLNSHISLPYHWEQCLDLQTGEIYYKNWSNGMKAKEDPRLISRTSGCSSDDDEEDDEEEDEDDDNDNEASYDSEGSSTIEHYSSPPPPYNYNNYSYNSPYGGVEMSSSYSNVVVAEEDVLVVAGCKGCLMYYMVPKHVLDCPKCTRHLLHFDRATASD